MRKIKPDVDLLRASLEGIKSNVLGILNKHNEIMLKSSEILFQQQQLEKAVSDHFFDFGDFERSKRFSILDSSDNFRIPEEYVAHREKSRLRGKANRVFNQRSGADVSHATNEMRQEVRNGISGFSSFD